MAAQVANTFDTYDMKGIRESLADFISNVAPEKTPFTSSLERVNAENTYEEWQTEDLAAPTVNNAYKEGEIYTYTAATPTVRLGNYCQIMRKEAIVTKTGDAVNTAGRAREMAHQVLKRGKELKRDKEKIFLNNQASVKGASTIARKLGGLPAWIETNAFRGTGGADGGFNTGTNIVDAATDATAGDMRAFTVNLMKDMLESVYTNSNNFASIISMHQKQKRVFSGFSGISELRTDAPRGKQAQIIGAADMYLSDWGVVSAIVNRWQRYRDVFALDYDLLRRGELRALNTVTPAETSDAFKRVMICEETLIVKNEKGLGVIADLTS